MRRVLRSSLRARLLLLVLLGALPAFALVLYSSAAQRRDAMDHARQEALEHAKRASDEHDHLVHGARQLLLGLARLPEVRGHDARRCSALFAEIVKQAPAYTTVGAATPSLDVFCSAFPVSQPVSVADRAYARRALATRGFVGGEYIVGRITGKRTLALAYPAVDGSGAVRAVLFAGLDLDWLHGLAARVGLPAGAVLAVIDGAGTVLARSPDAEGFVGRTLRDRPLVRTILASREGVAEAPGLEGTPRIVAFTPLAAEPAGVAAYVTVSIPRAVVFAAANRALGWNLAWLGLATALLLAVAWVGGVVFVGRSVQALVGATRRLAEGDLSARTGLPPDGGELGELARAFDHMAAGLEQRSERLRRANRALRVLSEVNQALLHAVGEPELLQRACRIVVEEGGYRLAWVGLTDPRGARTIRPAAHAGHGDMYLGSVDLDEVDTEAGQDPVATAIRTGRPSVATDVSTDPTSAPWRAEAARRGCGAVAALPLVSERRPLGALAIYAAEPGAFDPEETMLLAELADDLAHGITGLRARTAHARAEAALQESERRYRLLAENASDVISLFDLDGRLVYVSPSVTRLRGLSVEEDLAQTLEERLTPESLERARAALAEGLAREQGPERQLFRTRTVELEVRRKDGSTVWTETTFSTLRDGGGRLTGIIGVARDITERRRAAVELRLRAAALEAAANGVVITDRRGTILWVNEAFTGLTGYGRGEVVGRTPSVLRSGQHDRGFYAAMWETILAGRVWQGELVNRRRDGSLYTESQTITPVRDAGGEITHFVAIKEDVTDRKRAEESLRRQQETLYQSEKLAAMGQLLAGVAHELNNPLAVVLGRAALIERKAGEGPLKSDAEKISQAAERCARIVKNFLALARRRPLERQRVRLNQVVEEAVELLAYPLRVDTVEVRFDLAEGLPVLQADPHQLHQVVVNLVSNAHHALRGSTPPRRLVMTTRPGPGRGRVSLRVADSGPGIPEEIRARIFEPFFTTKAPGEGTGLGLSLCQGIVEAHGGTIRVESEPGQGAVFVIELPVDEPVAVAATVAMADGANAEAPIRGKTVLVVDDEPEMVNMLAEILALDGHHVEAAENGVAALAKLDERPWDLILTDLRMPLLDGPGLYREIERRDPRLCRRVIFFTGDTLSPQVTELLDRTGLPSLSKPVTPDEVRRVVQRALRALRG